MKPRYLGFQSLPVLRRSHCLALVNGCGHICMMFAHSCNVYMIYTWESLSAASIWSCISSQTHLWTWETHWSKIWQSYKHKRKLVKMWLCLKFHTSPATGAFRKPPSLFVLLPKLKGNIWHERLEQGWKERLVHFWASVNNYGVWRPGPRPHCILHLKKSWIISCFF